MTADEAIKDLTHTTIYSYQDNKRMFEGLLKEGIKFEVAYKLCKKQLGQLALDYIKCTKELKDEIGNLNS